MAKLRYKGIIEDAEITACTDQELEALIEIFAEKVTEVAATDEARAEFDLQAFSDISDNSLVSYKLTLRREQRRGKDLWRGTFEGNAKKLVIQAYLERNDSFV